MKQKQVYSIKQGQVSYEYHAIMGMILVLLVVYIISVTEGLSKKVSSEANQDLLVRLAQGIETVSNLAGQSSSLKVTAYAEKIQSQAVTGIDSFSFTDADGSSYSAVLGGDLRIFSGHNALVKNGLQHFSVIRGLRQKSLILGNEPAIIALCRESSVPLDELSTAEEPHCVDNANTPLKIRPNEGYYIVGANFDDLQAVGTKKVKTIPLFSCDDPQCTSNADCKSAPEICHINACLCATETATTSKNNLWPGLERSVIHVLPSSTGKEINYLSVKTYTGTSFDWRVDFDPTVPKGERGNNGEGEVGNLLPLV